MGAPGAGVSTLGKHLAARLGLTFLDTDDYHWFTSDPLPYKRKRNVEHRMRLLTGDLDALPGWVLSGALCGWGDPLIPRFDAVIYLWAPVEVRLERIRQRETARYGSERLAEGGDLHRVYQKFLDWAACYDTGDGLRSKRHEMAWLDRLPCPVFTLDGTEPVEVLCERIADSR